MTLDEIDLFCQALAGCEVRYPFESSPELRAWCINKRMFAWTVTNNAPLTIQVKADPDLIPMLIQNYACVSPGYHMNKKHWLSIDATTSEGSLITGLLEDAHGLVAAKLPKAERIRLISD